MTLFKGMVRNQPGVRTRPLGGIDDRLASAAHKAAATAYAPYSKYLVGAAVLTRSGRVYVGSNLENAAYGLGICAEVSALTAANSSADFDVIAVAVASRFACETVEDTIITPCGRCRQLIFEASKVSGEDIRVICCNSDLSKRKTFTISELLPEAFGPEDLGVDIEIYKKR